MGLSIIDRVRRLLATSPMRRVRTGLGGSHTVVTYPPLDALPLMEGNEPFELSPPQGGLNLYFHVAFCEWICAFCHYAKTLHTRESQSAEIDDYLSALEGEVAMRRASLAGADLKSIYIGGGTPTALEPRRLERLLTLASRAVDGVTPEICVETSPMTLADGDGAEKLAILRAHGATRLSIGVQSFDADLLEDLRGHTQAVLVGAIERLFAANVVTNIDLIQDLPGQTRQSVDGDLEWIGRLKPSQVTWYVLRFHAESSMGKAYPRSGVSVLVDDLESALRRDHIIKRMSELGYTSQAGCRFTRDGVTDHYKAVRGGVDRHLLGFGVSAYSHGWGWFFRNKTSRHVRDAIRDYIDSMQRDASPVGWAAAVDSTERRAGRLCEGARDHISWTLVVNKDANARAARAVIDRLVEYDLMQRTESGWRLTRLGKLFEEEVVSLFYSVSMRRRLRADNAYWADDGWFRPKSEAGPVNQDLLCAALWRSQN